MAARARDVDPVTPAASSVSSVAAGGTTSQNEGLGTAGRVALLGLVTAGLITATNSPSPVVLLLMFIPYTAVGALLIVRRPRTSIGWILLGIGLCSAIVSVDVTGTDEEVAGGTVELAPRLLAVAHAGSITALILLYAVLAIVFPSGRLPGGRWGVVVRVALSGGSLLVAAACLSPTIGITVAGSQTPVQIRNPIAVLPDVAAWGAIPPGLTFVPVMPMVLAGGISLIVRLRHASGAEREQLRWFASAIAIVVAAVICGFILATVIPSTGDNGLAWIPASLAFPAVPVAVGIAVLRYRLYEIDRIISRTLGWAAVTGLLGAIFVALIVGLQAVLSTVTGGSTLAVAASTLVAAALFQPLRRRVQTAVDHRFNRARYDAQQTAETFSESLRNEVDLTRLRTALLATADLAVRPASASVWLRARSAGR